jgi:hypothetical protein
MAGIQYPWSITHKHTVNELVGELKTSSMRDQLEDLSSSHDHFYLTPSGQAKTLWAVQEVMVIIKNHNTTAAKLTTFLYKHWPQDSVMVGIPGQSGSKIIVGAHLDSVKVAMKNMSDTLLGSAPGAGGLIILCCERHGGRILTS